MKKAVLVAAAAATALALAELFVSLIVGYPAYGVKMKLSGIRGLDEAVNVFRPYSRYWTVEGGNRVYRRNNLGLPGVDIRASGEAKYVFVLGDSFVEAYQVAPERIATSVLQSRLAGRRPEVQVLNLGISGHDPYDLYWRAGYYEREFEPARVCLVIEKANTAELGRQRRPLNFDPGAFTPRPLKSKKVALALTLFNASSFFYLTSNLVRPSKLNDVIKEDEDLDSRDDALTDDLRETLRRYQGKFGDRFRLVAIGRSPVFRDRLGAFCLENGIRCLSAALTEPENRIGGGGHLNEHGNRLLGELLYEALARDPQI